MPSGEVYVQVDASVINGGIAPMALVSGNPEPVAGQESFGVWLRWQYESTTGEGGFTGSGWFFDDPNNPLKDTFLTEAAFKEYLVRDTPKDLDTYLGSWDAERKAAFFDTHQDALGVNHCFSFVG